MKNLVFVLLLFVSFQSVAQVVIKPETAQYFLEADDERYILRKKVAENTGVIADLNKEILSKDLIVASYKADAMTRLAEMVVIKQERNDMIKDIEYLEWEVKRQHRLKTTFAGAGIGVIAGSIAGPGGAVLGGAVGGGIGYVVGLFKKKI